MKVVLSVPAMTGGVSTQPEPLRLPQQADRSDNMLATVIDGLRVRPPSEYLSHMVGWPISGKAHTVNSLEGDYILNVESGFLRVYPASGGSPLTVRNAAGSLADTADFQYLVTSNTQDDIRFLTLADYTLILNRSKVTKATIDTTAAKPSEGMVGVISGAYAKYYRVRVTHPDGDAIEVQFESWSSNGTPPGGGTANVPAAENSVRTDVIAKELEGFLKTGVSPSGIVGGTIVSGLSGGLPPLKWAVDRFGSVLRVKRLDGSDFTMTVAESQGGTSLRLIHREVQLFSDLTAQAPEGMRIFVNGDPEKSAVGYWVEFDASDPTVAPGSWGEGSWIESVAPLISKGLDYTTLPHALLRQANGEFRFVPLAGGDYTLSGTIYKIPKWSDREAGDLDTNKNPGFVGQKIRAMCFHEGRLGLLCDDAFTLSETREPFSFFRTTVLDVLDSDRIEVALPTVRAEELSHVAPLNGDIVLFSDQTQYVLRSTGPFAPNSVALVAAGRYDASPTSEPVVVRDSLFVPSTLGDWGRVQEVRVQGDTRPTLTAFPTTASAESYVPPIRQLLTTPQLDIVIALPAVPSADLWVYTQFWNVSEKVQQAWQKFTLAESPEIRHAWFFGTALYLIADYGPGDVHLLKMRLDGAAKDTGAPKVHLDRRLSHDQLSVLAGSVSTALTLPYAAQGEIRVVEEVTGKEMRVLSTAGDSVVIAGSHPTRRFWVGATYAWRYDFSKVYMADRNSTPVIDGDLRLDYGCFYFADAGPFRVALIPEVGDETQSQYSGPYLGQGANYQNTRLTSGKFQFPIRQKAREVRVSLRGQSPWGGRFISADFAARILQTSGGQRQ